MSASTILPMEDMLSVGGWTIYVVGACLVICFNVWTGHLVYDLWKLTLKAVPAFWGTRKLHRLLPYFGVVKAMALLKIFAGYLTFGLMLTASSLLFADFIVHQKVQAVRFDPKGCELIYRWTRFDERIAYDAISGLKWETMPTLALWSGRPQKRVGKVQIVIETPGRTYVIFAPGNGSEFRNAQAVYAELKARIASRGAPPAGS